MAQKPLLLALLAGSLAMVPTATPAQPRGIALSAGNAATARGLLTAGTDGATWTFPGGATVHAQPNTELRLFTVPQGLVLSPGKRTPTYTIILQRGTLELDAREGKSALLVTTPGKVNAIATRGTTVVAALGSERRIAALTGEVLVSNAGNYAAMPQGQVAIYRPGEAKALQPLTTAPVLVQVPRVLTARDGSATLSGVSWRPVPNAAAYRLELVSTDDATPWVRHESASALSAPLGPLPRGHYALTVRSLGEGGIPGASSLPARITVVGAELPRGAFVDRNGVVRLGRGQAVAFSPIDGLDVSYGAGGRFRKADGAVPLFADDATRVYFRAKDGSNVAQFSLAPRGAHAAISFSPKNPVWPAQAVRITVRLTGPDAEAIAGVEPRLTVKLGTEELTVQTERTTDGLTAVLPPRASGGPWVIRAEVRDQHGLQLGRDFVEVASVKSAVARRQRALPPKESLSAR